MSLLADYGNLYQLGYVTRDLERGMAAIHREIGPADFVLTETDMPVRADGVIADVRMRVALATVGSRQIEIIEPISGAVGIYTEGIDLSAADIVFHHVGLAVPGLDGDWERLEAELAERDLAFKLVFPPEPMADPVARFAYVDTRHWCGHYTEYLWWSDALDGGPTFPFRAQFTVGE